MDTRKLLVCIPTYNEIDNIDWAMMAVRRRIDKGHVLVIDDASPDGTGEKAATIAATRSRLHVLHRSRKEGLGAAHRAGFEWGLSNGFDYVVQFDADGSHDPQYLEPMISQLAHFQMVIASRRVPFGKTVNWRFHRRLLSAAGTAWSKGLLNLPIKDLTSGFNGFQRCILERIDFDGFLSNQYFFQVELKYHCYHLGASHVEFPIVFGPRCHGHSKITLDIVLDAIVQAARLRFRGTETS